MKEIIKRRQDLHIVRGQFEMMANKIRPAVLEKCNNKCVNCGTDKNLQIDHIVALSLGGSNEMDNYQILCKSCNLSKGGRRMQPKGLKRVSLTIKLKDTLYKKISKMAKEDSRSLNNYIEVLLCTYEQISTAAISTTIPKKAKKKNYLTPPNLKKDYEKDKVHKERCGYSHPERGRANIHGT